MLNKKIDAPVAVQVPIASYSGSLESRLRRPYVRPEPGTPHDDVPNSFVLFHQDLRTAARAFGLLVDSDAVSMWRVVARNIETFDPCAEEPPADAPPGGTVGK